VEAILYLFSLLGSGAGFMTQMLVSGYWTTAFSQDVYYFSVNLAFYLLALGLGSLISLRIPRVSYRGLAGVLIALFIVAGGSISFLRLGIKYFGNTIWVPLCPVIFAGVLTGLVIPLTLRLGEKYPRMSLGFLFFIDYGAATLFSVVFSFYLLIPLGYSKTALLMVLLSSVLTLMGLAWIRELSGKLVLGSFLGFVFCFGLYFLSGAHVAPRMDHSGVAKIIHNEQSHYQKIVLTEEVSAPGSKDQNPQYVLFLDGFVQFSSRDEQNYHLCLADIPMFALNFYQRRVSQVLILGGGDGLAARNILRNPTVEAVKLVELDPAMIRLASENPQVRKLNLDSLHHPKVKVEIADAFRWVQDHRNDLREKFDLILIDFPAPKNLTLSRLFSAEFYRAALQLLKPGGFASIQAGPSYSFEDPQRKTLSKVTASLLKTIASLGYRSFPYATPEDSEAFVLVASDKTFDMEKFARQIGIYTGGLLATLCRYDSHWGFPSVEKNTLNTLKLSQYMNDWFQQYGKVFFYYRGNHLVFLPD
jgi:spermidine synthase